MRDTINIISNPDADFLGHSVIEFLYHLDGPTWIDITGKDTSRTRVMTTLLHGNEPSGVKAIFNYLTDANRKQPLTNISFMICSVKAALLEPDFTHRYLPGEPDMNRCFRPPFECMNGMLAKNILERISELKPEAMIDVHNTSGSGPDFTICSGHDSIYEIYAKNFSSRLIQTDLSLGSIMEADVGCPILTLECGGSFDLSADLKAIDAINQLVTHDDLFVDNNQPLNIYAHPLRFEIKDDVSIGYSEAPLDGIDVTLEADIEVHNFGVTDKKCFLGWVGNKGLDYFTAIDDTGHDIKDELFYVDNGKLFTKKTLRLFMVTPRPEIAKKDCLFYLVMDD
ncbi:hypothetical protein [Pseudemcibacter aquimaris]|uniref:hypothetical protein n=1 Tax=Pseudemcibacter aquimaris TaxID=2857064 RepID=UPI002011100D|nr:hypothetical protein [Pseudemcibacter aquimaris]MCC3860205.1 hypothetical protein [Pseudemcibacter aquimaris]WDU57530.1 hypothetical protein KW060_10020 [Pseudemcibacter aquimaris]